MKKNNSKKLPMLAVLLTSTFLFSSCQNCKEGQEKSGLSCKELASEIIDEVTTAPTAPSSLVATKDSGSPTSTINLTWIDNSDNEDGFAVERSIDNVTFSSLTQTAANATTYSDTGLTGSTTYYYRVSAVNTAGSSAPTSESHATTNRTFKYLFVSTSTPSANMVGATNADSICNADASRPVTTSTYKAMLGATNGTAQSRTACTTANCSTGSGEHTRWVLIANQEYRRADGTTVIGTTTSVGIFAFPLANSFGTCTGGVAWGGFATNWTSSVNSCGGWTFGGVNDARLINCTSTTSSAIDMGSNQTCAASRNIICAEQ